jgi:hypothetical protein
MYTFYNADSLQGRLNVAYYFLLLKCMEAVWAFNPERLLIAGK